MRNVFILLSLILVKMAAAQDLAPCKVTLDAKPYFISPMPDTVTVAQLMQAPLLQTGKEGLTVISFQMSTKAPKPFPEQTVKWFVIGRSVRTNAYAISYLKNVKPGQLLILECVKVKDPDGQTFVMQNRTYIIK